MDSMMDKTRARRVRMLWAGTALALGAAQGDCISHRSKFVHG